MVFIVMLPISLLFSLTFFCILCPICSTKIEMIAQKDQSLNFVIHGKPSDVELAKKAIKTAFTPVRTVELRIPQEYHRYAYMLRCQSLSSYVYVYCVMTSFWSHWMQSIIDLSLGKEGKIWLICRLALRLKSIFQSKSITRISLLLLAWEKIVNWRQTRCRRLRMKR